MPRAHPTDAGIRRVIEEPVRISTNRVTLAGILQVPQDASGVVLFAHGSGSGRHSPRNRFVARVLAEAGLATLLIDLLTAKEETIDAATGHLRFDIELLAERVADATEWLAQTPQTGRLAVGYFGASTGAAAALVAAARQGASVGAIVSRGGRPDLAGEALQRVEAPTLLIVGGDDGPVIGLNQQALDRLGAEHKQMVIVPGATHLFEEPGALEKVARLAQEWFNLHLNASTSNHD
jgi:dienelactone hydrolase